MNLLRKLPDWPVYFAFIVINLLVMIMYSNFALNAHQQISGDALSYIQMSQRWFPPVDNPFAMRLLSPTIVKLAIDQLGMNLNHAWLLLTFIATTLSVIVFYHFMRHVIRVTPYMSVILTLMLTVTYSYTLFNYFDFWLVDPLNNLVYVLALIFLFRSQWTAFYVTLAIGALNKEVALFLLPLGPIFSYLKHNSWQHREVKATIIGFVATCLAYIIFRKTVVQFIPENYTYALFHGTEHRTWAENIRFALSHNKDIYTLFHIFDFLWVFFFYGLYRIYQAQGWRSPLFLTSIYLLATVVFGRFFATDANRVFVMAAPMVFAVTGTLLSTAQESPENERWLLIFAFIYVASQLGWLQQPGVLAGSALVLLAFTIRLHENIPLAPMAQETNTKATTSFKKT